MTRIIVSEDAETDLDDVLDYLEREAGSRTASSYAERFKTAIALILEYPGSGSPRPALGAAARISIVYPYVLIYDYVTDDDTVFLLRIVHGRRNIAEQLIRRSKKF